MIGTLLLMKVIAVAQGIFGAIGVILVLSTEMQADLIYRGRSPLAGDAKKYLVWGMCFCLVLGAFCPWLKPSASPFWAWLALGFHLISSGLDAVTLRGHAWCRRCVVTGVTVKASAALVLTCLASVHASAGNG